MNSSWLHLELKIRGPNFHFLIRDTVTRRAHVTLAPNFIFKELGKRKFNVFIIYFYGEHDFLDSFSYMHSVFPYKAVWSDPRRLVVSSIPTILIVICWKKIIILSVIPPNRQSQQHGEDVFDVLPNSSFRHPCKLSPDKRRYVIDRKSNALTNSLSKVSFKSRDSVAAIREMVSASLLFMEIIS